MANLDLNVGLRKEANTAILLLVIAPILWGTATVAIKFLYSVGTTTSFTVSWFRLSIAAAVLLFAKTAISSYPTHKALLTSFLSQKTLFLFASLCLAGYQLLLFAALKKTGVTPAVTLDICSAPIFTAFMEWLVFKERPTARVWFLMATAIAGAAVLSGLTNFSFLAGTSHLEGALLAVMAGACYAGYCLISRLLLRTRDSATVVTITFAVGSVLLTPFVFGQGLVTQFGLSGWGILFYLGLVPSAIAYLCFLGGMKSKTASFATTLALLEPLTATMLAVIILGERVTLLEGIGGTVSLISLLLIARS